MYIDYNYNKWRKALANKWIVKEYGRDKTRQNNCFKIKAY